MSIVVNRKPTGAFIKFTPQLIRQIVSGGRLPIVKTASGESLPVDDVGFVFYGKRWEIESYPSREDIETARKILLDVRVGASRQGCSKRVSLSEIKTELESCFNAPYVTNGAMIVAASQLGWKIDQEDINGIVAVSRSWWQSLR